MGPDVVVPLRGGQHDGSRNVARGSSFASSTRPAGARCTSACCLRQRLERRHYDDDPTSLRPKRSTPATDGCACAKVRTGRSTSEVEPRWSGVRRRVVVNTRPSERARAVQERASWFTRYAATARRPSPRRRGLPPRIAGEDEGDRAMTRIAKHGQEGRRRGDARLTRPWRAAGTDAHRASHRTTPRQTISTQHRPSFSRAILARESGTERRRSRCRAPPRPRSSRPRSLHRGDEEDRRHHEGEEARSGEAGGGGEVELTAERDEGLERLGVALDEARRAGGYRGRWVDRDDQCHIADEAEGPSGCPRRRVADHFRSTLPPSTRRASVKARRMTSSRSAS